MTPAYQPSKPLRIKLGTFPRTGLPIYIPENALNVGGFFEGSPGTGKTTTIATYVEQHIAQVHHHPMSFVIIDLKGDTNSNELFHVLRLAAKKAGIPFKWSVITDPSLEIPTFGCNPLAMEFWQLASARQRANFVVDSTGLRYGNDWSKAFFSAMMSSLAIIERKNFPHSLTWRQLNRAVTYLRNLPPKERPPELHEDYIKHSSAYSAALEALSEHDALNVAPGGDQPIDVVDNRIDFRDAFRTPQVYYFAIDTTLGGSAAVIAGRQLFFALQFTARLCERRIPVMTVGDELHSIASNPLKNVLNTLRSCGPLVLATQTIADLKTSEVDLTPNTENLGFHWRGSVNDPEEQRRFSDNSAKTAVHHGSFSGLPNLFGYWDITSYTMREELAPNYSQAEVALVSANPELAFLTVSRDSEDCAYNGLPIVVRRIPRPDMAQYARVPFPLDEPGTFIPAVVEPETDPLLGDLAGPVPSIHVNGEAARRRQFQIQSKHR